MFIIKINDNFDAAHFLVGHKGKCKNIHGHRWNIEIELENKELIKDGSSRGMIIDFKDLKNRLKEITNYFDHSLIVEKNSLKKNTFECLKSDGFKIIEVNFRPTAENFSKFIYDYFSEIKINLKKVTVYETPNNSAMYIGDEK